VYKKNVLIILCIVSLFTFKNGFGVEFINKRGSMLNNPWVNDVPAKFAAIDEKVDNKKGRQIDHKNIITWPRYSTHIKNTYKGLAGRENHFQGINRLSGWLGLGQYLVLSGGDPHRNESHLFIAKDDKFVKEIALDNVFWHAGGMQVVGKYLAVPLENAEDHKSKIVFYDMTRPENPQKISTEIVRPNRRCGTVSMTRLIDGHYLVVIWVDSDGQREQNRFDFYYSNGTILEKGFPTVPTTKVYHNQVVNITQSSVKKCGTYQMVNLVNDVNGTLYLIGTWNTSSAAPIINGKDYAHLLQISFNTTTKKAAVNYVAEKHFYCKTGIFQPLRCCFNAGAGVDIPSQDSIAIYAVTHWLDSKSDYVRYYVFRNYDHKK